MTIALLLALPALLFANGANHRLFFVVAASRKMAPRRRLSAQLPAWHGIDGTPDGNVAILLLFGGGMASMVLQMGMWLWTSF
jgi:hypothetical protein